MFLSHLPRSGFLTACIVSSTLVANGLCADTFVVPVTVTATDHDLKETPINVEVVPFEPQPVKTTRTDITPYQMGPAEGPVNATVSWIVRDLKKGEKRTYYLAQVKNPPAPGTGVEVKRNGENAEFFINGRLFARYDTTTGPNKPYFYPLNAPGGRQIVRHAPLEKVEGETTDHPHHRGLWFTHGKVNGVDFWMEGKNAGKTVHTGYEALASGPVYGTMRTRTDWLTPDNKKIAEDWREVRVYNTNNNYVMDFAITIKAVGGPLTFGDTKEGSFGLRLADSMRVNPGRGKKGEGHILNSAGDKDAAAWGKAAAWCDYYGPVDGQVIGVAIFDHPKNPRHPTTWHVRDYGLFAANPFGLHDFDKKNPEGAGDLVVPEGQSVTFQYRLLFHPGTTEEARIADAWKDYSAHPPVRFGAGTR